MIINKIRIKNYKTYLALDLDLSVKEDRPIVLIGGHNGGGKTTLFEAITGALYGLKIRDKAHFEDLLNDGADKSQDRIELEITFTGLVLDKKHKYIITRTYALNTYGMPVEAVRLNMNGNIYTYGTATPAAQRQQSEQEVNKIIKANLPQELSQYFLFDAMQSSELLKENNFRRIIKENFENVMGFNKYIQLRRISEKLQQDKTNERLQAEEDKNTYERYCSQKKELEEALQANTAEQDKCYQYLTQMKENYDLAKKGVRDLQQTQRKIADIAARIAEIQAEAKNYISSAEIVAENLEQNIFLPHIAHELANEINNIIRSKESIKRAKDNSYPEEKVREIAQQVIAYMQDRQLIDANFRNEEVVVQFILSQQEQTSLKDRYATLDDEDVNALIQMLKLGGGNPFPTLYSQKQSCDTKLASIEQLTIQKQDLERQLVGGDIEIINAYEAQAARLNTLQNEEKELKEKITTLTRRIEQYDITVQQEPDLQYDTLVKLKPLFENIADALLKKKREQIETEMKENLNKLLISYQNHIARVELSESLENFNIRLFHTAGNEISLNQLNAASKQIFIQVLLKVLRNLGDYNPPVMIDTVMGVLDEESREALMEEYFPQLAEQTILLCTTSEIRKDSDYEKLAPFISRSYTLHRNVELQHTNVTDGYFGIILED